MSEQREKIAKQVYGAMIWAAGVARQAPKGGIPSWQDGGNSDAQITARQWADAILSLPQGPVGWRDGIEAAAKFIDEKVKAYVEEYGMYDHTTGQTEFPGNGEEWLGDMEELAEDIRALPAAPGQLEQPTAAEAALEALTLIERVYYMEDQPAHWRAATMNGIARDAQNNESLSKYQRLFPRTYAEDSQA